MISKQSLICLVAVVFCVGCTYAVNDEDKASVLVAMSPFLKACSEEQGMAVDEYLAIRKKGTTEGIKPCFFSCLLKKTEIMNSKGIYDVEKSIEFGKKHIKSDKGIEIYTKIANHCAKVNDVIDGEEGCERAKQFFDCSDEQMKDHKLN